VKTRGTGVTGNESAQQWVGDMSIDRVFISVDVDLGTCVNDRDQYQCKAGKAHPGFKCDRDGFENVLITPRPRVDEK
jgi:hypothetical protein